MKRILIPLGIYISCLFMVSCNAEDRELPAEIPVSESGFDQAKAKAFIDSINLKFTEQVHNGDSVSLASHYWPDAEILLSDSEPVKGADIASVWGSMIRMGVKHFTFQTTDITLGGNLLVETGTYEMKAEDQSLIDRGKYVVVWKFQNGEWKLFRDIGNSSLPARAAK